MTEALKTILRDIGDVAIAVSGGVDSMTLAYLAAESGARAEMFHAISPAVPEAATARVKAHAAKAGWRLRIIGAGEFDDPDYLKNPVNRCYFCKSNLYTRIGAATDAVICSGANTGDLGDYRPGLGAASERNVRHPFIEAGIDKPVIRAMAAERGLSDLADLPAQPCLASRVETGIAINADDLALVDAVETRLAARLGAGDIRCRVTHSGVRVELPEAALTADLTDIADMVRATGRVFAGAAPYRRGSAFLRGAS